MGSEDVRRAADSAPTAGRDFGGEIQALLRRADEARAQAESIDLAGAVEATLQRTAAAAGEAMERGSDAAEGARAKIHDQQERFKAGIVAGGGSLDEEVPGGFMGNRRAQDGVAAPGPGNRYAALMDRRKHAQEQQRM